MAKNRKATALLSTDPDNQKRTANSGSGNPWLETLKRRKLAAAAILFVSIGAFGATLKHLDESARIDKKLAAKDRSLISSINPFLPPPPTPQLSREYLYAGSRLLAVEDKNATAAPPTDLAVWRPSTGTWYVLGGPGSQQTIHTGWGTSTDEAAEGDYDGDGKTDFSVFRPSENNWYIVLSSNSTTYVPNFGASGDKPAQADYDGDGKTDPAVYRPPTGGATNGSWFVQGSSAGFYGETWGEGGDIPASADYDGDGRADFAVWRPGTQKFYSINSGDGAWRIGDMAQAGEPVSTDYDGDGRADFAIFTASTGTWKIHRSTTATFDVTTGWGIGGDIPVPNDYDGDARSDITVWRPADGTWYIKQSATGTLRGVPWGQPGDIPVPAFYRR